MATVHIKQYMPVTHILKGGVLKAVLATVLGTPLFASAADSGSPVVVESREATVTYQPPIEIAQQSSQPSSQPSSGIENQYQMQLLQQEVMELRGTVEQLQYELNRQKSVQDDRYLELDSRLQQVLQMRVAAPEAAASDPVVETPSENENAVDTSTLSEQALYNTTQQLIRNRQYELAITQLESLIDRFPEGEYTANTYYWLGQVQAAKTNPDFEKARQALVQVITYFPEHSKVPDAAFALGKVLHTLGDCERARSTLEQVRDQYPGKSAAKLAANYLRESVNCES